MNRVTEEQVKQIIEVEEGAILEPFITTANELVTEFCVGQGYTDARLALIELWLAAHFYTIRDPRMASEGAGGISVSSQGRTDMGLDSSLYGQHAIVLDTAGGLRNLQKGRKKISMTWLGTVKEDGT